MQKNIFLRKMHKPLSRLFLALLISAIIFEPASALADIYQCEKNGQTQYSQTACTNDEKQIGRTTISAATNPSREDQQAAIARQKSAQAELKQLQQKRIKEQEKQEKIASKQLVKSQQHKAACDKAQLQVKWAREDADTAPVKSETKAKRQLKRAKEKADLICK